VVVFRHAETAQATRGNVVNQYNYDRRWDMTWNWSHMKLRCWLVVPPWRALHLDNTASPWRRWQTVW